MTESRNTINHQKKTIHFWDVFFVLSYPIGIGLFFLSQWNGERIGGSALGGKYIGGKFLLITSSNPNVNPDLNTFKVVSGFIWITDLMLALLSMCLGLLMIVGMGYFFFKYLVPYVRRSAKGNRRF